MFKFLDLGRGNRYMVTAVVKFFNLRGIYNWSIEVYDYRV